jgi:hypothetical protein
MAFQTTHHPDEDYTCSPADLAQARLTYTEHPSVSCIDVPYQDSRKHWLAMECEEEMMQILVAVSGAAGEGAATVTVHVTRSVTRPTHELALVRAHFTHHKLNGVDLLGRGGGRSQ